MFKTWFFKHIENQIERKISTLKHAVCPRTFACNRLSQLHENSAYVSTDHSAAINADSFQAVLSFHWSDASEHNLLCCFSNCNWKASVTAWLFRSLSRHSIPQLRTFDGTSASRSSVRELYFVWLCEISSCVLHVSPILYSLFSFRLVSYLRVNIILGSSQKKI